MSKRSTHVERARALQDEASSLMAHADWAEMKPDEAMVNCLSAIESRLGALTGRFSDMAEVYLRQSRSGHRQITG